MTINDEIKQVVGQINKARGDESIKLGSDIPAIKRIPTGSLELDYITGGGIPIGRWTRMWGGPSSGKSKVSYQVIANAQKMGISCAYFNLEKQFTPDFAELHGIDVSELLIVDGSIIEDCGEIMEALMPTVDLFVLDSCSAAISRVELSDGLNEKEYIGIRARKWGQQFAFWRERFDYTRHVVIQIDQARVQFNPNGMSSLAPPGGKVMEHESSMTLEFKKGKWLWEKDDGSLSDVRKAGKTLSGDSEPDGIEVQARCQKSRVCKPFRTARLAINFDTGKFDWLEEYVKAAKFFGVVEVNGGWYKYDGKSMRPTEFRELLQENKNLQEEIYNIMVVKE